MDKKVMVVTLCALAVGLLFGTAAQAADPDLIAWWKLDDGTGTVALDSSGYENHGTVMGGATWVDDADRGAVISFDGSTGYIDTPVIIPAQTLDNSFSWVFWIMQPASQAVNNDTILGNRYGGTGSPLQFCKFTPTRFEAYNDDGAYVNGINYDPFPSDVWVHNAVVKNGAELTYYRNGVVTHTNTMTKTLDENPFYMGADGFSGAAEGWEGFMSDVRLYTRALSEAEVLAAMAGKPPTSEIAADPVPETEAIDIPLDVVLTWTPGEYAATHDVYLGTVAEDVNNADRANPMGVLLSEGQTDASFAPEGILELGQTYYWRVDEVNAAPDNTIFKGELWSFTAEPVGYPIEGIVATCNLASDEGVGPERTVDGSGLRADGTHSTTSEDMWLVTAGAETVQLTYEFDRVYKLHEMHVWNYNVLFELILGFGLKEVTVEYSVDGAEWTVLGDFEFAQATAREDYTANTTVDFGGVPAQYVRLTVNNGYGTMGQLGLSEVQILYIPAHAREPEPADGAADVSVTTGLAWRAGRDAVSYEVYLGTDADAPALLDTTSGTSTTPGALDLATTYYWQVTAVQDVESWAGTLWDFVTQEYLVVDDFESYDDEDNRIYDTWLDGWVNDTGSTVGHLESPFAERSIVNSGTQSMPLFYDNSESATAEAELELSANWTAHGVGSLSLSFYGDPDNTGQLYVKINDTRVDYDGPAADLASQSWQSWSIDLSTVGNVSSVRSLTIGIEGAGASGVVYVDDIRLYP